MKFTVLTFSLALAVIASSAVLPSIPGGSGAIGGIEGAAEGTLSSIGSHGVKRGATDGVTGSLNGIVGIAGSAAGTVESTTSNAAYTGENLVSGAVPVHERRDIASASGTANNVTPEISPDTTEATQDLDKRILPGAGNLVKASLVNDLALLSGNPSGLIGALGGLHSALAAGDITGGQIAALPTALQEVVAYLYTA